MADLGGSTDWGRRAALTVFAIASGIVVVALVKASAGLVDDIAAILALSVLAGVVTALWPSLDLALAARPMGGLIAFVGCDGSGKSTLTEDIGRELEPLVPVRICYLGLGSAAMGDRIRRWPLVGPAFERKLARKATQSRTRGEKIPGLATASVIYLLSLLRLRRFKRMLRLRRAGYVVLTDRYPQVEVPGCYDGPGLSAAVAGSWAVAQLVRRERRIYDWMAAFRPDVIVRLNVDAETALVRKPDHRAELIARKVAITPTLRFAGSRIVDVDAALAYPIVRSQAARVVDEALGHPAARTRVRRRREALAKAA